jgi:hypothetical protein
MGSEALGSLAKDRCFVLHHLQPTMRQGRCCQQPSTLLKWPGADLKEVVTSAVHQQLSPQATQSDIAFSFVITFRASLYTYYNLHGYICIRVHMHVWHTIFLLPCLSPLRSAWLARYYYTPLELHLVDCSISGELDPDPCKSAWYSNKSHPHVWRNLAEKTLRPSRTSVPDKLDGGFITSYDAQWPLLYLQPVFLCAG